MRELRRYGSIISRASYAYKAEQTYHQQSQNSYSTDNSSLPSQTEAVWMLIKTIADLLLLDRVACRIAIVDELLKRL